MSNNSLKSLYEELVAKKGFTSDKGFGSFNSLRELLTHMSDVRNNSGSTGCPNHNSSLFNDDTLRDSSFKTIKTAINNIKGLTCENYFSHPGCTCDNPVFTYLNAFATDEHFRKYLPEYKNLDELKDHYERGGLGDMKVKRFLNDVMQEVMEPIRKRREEYECRKEELLEILKQGTLKSISHTNKILNEVKKAVGINYFDDDSFKATFINEKNS